jgi:hypothetical protein
MSDGDHRPPSLKHMQKVRSATDDASGLPAIPCYVCICSELFRVVVGVAISVQRAAVPPGNRSHRAPLVAEDRREVSADMLEGAYGYGVELEYTTAREGWQNAAEEWPNASVHRQQHH